MVFDVHDRAFAFFRGAYARGIHDNMKTAVETVFIGKDQLFSGSRGIQHARGCGSRAPDSLRLSTREGRKTMRERRSAPRAAGHRRCGSAPLSVDVARGRRLLIVSGEDRHLASHAMRRHRRPYRGGGEKGPKVLEAAGQASANRPRSTAQVRKSLSICRQYRGRAKHPPSPLSGEGGRRPGGDLIARYLWCSTSSMALSVARNAAATCSRARCFKPLAVGSSSSRSTS